MFTALLEIVKGLACQSAPMNTSFTARSVRMGGLGWTRQPPGDKELQSASHCELGSPTTQRGMDAPGEEKIMAQVICEVSEGLRKAEAMVKLISYDGRPEFMPVDRGLLSTEGETHFLSVPVIHISNEKQAALIALPVEADSGAHRVWVHLNQIKPDHGTRT
jgi:hypothetical protein